MNKIKPGILLLATVLMASGMVITTVSANDPTITTAANVTHGNLTTINVTPPTANVAPSGTQNFTATTLDNATNTIENVNIAWTIDNTSVGSISPLTGTTDMNGNTNTIFTAGLNPGTATITASATNESGVKIIGTAVVNVVEIKSITINETLIDFGNVKAGELSAPQNINITNTGNVNVKVNITASNMTGTKPANVIPASAIGMKPTPPLTVGTGSSADEEFVLNVPSTTKVDKYSGTIDFVADP